MSRLSPMTEDHSSDFHWRGLCRFAGMAALIAGILFRRNIAAEIALFSGRPSPATVNDWFALLQNNRFLGLSYLNVFDIVNYALIGLMFLALYAVLRRVSRGSMAVATAFGLVGITAYFASNSAFSMLSLSQQYAAATTEAQKTMLSAAGQAILAIDRGAYPGTGGYISLLLIAMAGLIASMVMIRSKEFNRATAFIGILASGLDLAYCIAYAFVPTIDGKLLSVCFIPAAGLFLMVWHIMVGWKLWRLGGIHEERCSLAGKKASI